MERKEFNDRKSMYPRDPRYPATGMSINAHKLTNNMCDVTGMSINAQKLTCYGLDIYFVLCKLMRNGLDLHICRVTSMPINAHKLTRYGLEYVCCVIGMSSNTHKQWTGICVM